MLLPYWVTVELAPISGVYGRESGYNTGQHRDTQDKQGCTPKGNRERPINLTVMFLDCGSWSTRREPTYARGEHANSMYTNSRTQDLLSATQHWYQLRHRVALVKTCFQ
ncbi:hypothetical protein AMECASPLE_020233 [Ameca splendens]|uniref:Uncharacterized protein n=1 Tax=Ameca splendens TaxID=208324 RepID=A0ABV0ZZH2_9TELE